VLVEGKKEGMVKKAAAQRARTNGRNQINKRGGGGALKRGLWKEKTPATNRRKQKSGNRPVIFFEGRGGKLKKEKWEMVTKEKKLEIQRKTSRLRRGKGGEGRLRKITTKPHLKRARVREKD